MSFNMWFYIYYYYFETSATDGKQKRIINVNVIQVVSALHLSTTCYITTNVCTVFKWQQIVRKWGRCTFEDFSCGFVFTNYENLVKSNTLITKHIIRISFFTQVFFSRNCMFDLKQLLHMQWPQKYYIRSFRSDKQKHVFFFFKEYCWAFPEFT